MTVEQNDNNVQLGSQNKFHGPVHVYSAKSVSSSTIAISLTVTLSLTVGTFLIAKNYYQISKPEPPTPASPTLSRPIADPPAPPVPSAQPPSSPPSVPKHSVARHDVHPKVVYDHRPRDGEQRGCRIPSQSSCALVVKAGGGGEAEETYEFQSNKPGRKIKRAELRFSVVIEDEPANPHQPNITNYWIQVTINGKKLDRVFKPEGLGRGYPKNQQFDPGSFREYKEELNLNEFDHINPVKNTISYWIGGAPVGAWMLFRWSELRVEYE